MEVIDHMGKHDPEEEHDHHHPAHGIDDPCEFCNHATAMKPKNANEIDLIDDSVHMTSQTNSRDNAVDARTDF